MYVELLIQLTEPLPIGSSYSKRLSRYLVYSTKEQSGHPTPRVEPPTDSHSGETASHSLLGQDVAEVAGTNLHLYHSHSTSGRRTLGEHPLCQNRLRTKSMTL